MNSHTHLRRSAVLSGVFLIIALMAGQASAGEKYEEKFGKTVAMAKDGTVDLTNVAGDIEVKSWDRDEVKIEALKVSKAGTSDKAREDAEKVRIEVEKKNGTVRIKTEYPEQRKWRTESLNVSVDYRLWVPVRASVRITNVTGKVALDGIGGSVKLKLVTGNAEIRKVGGSVDSSVVTGNLTIEEVAGDADLNVTTGDVSAKRMKGAIKVNIVTGKIELVDISEARTVDGRAVSGSIVYQGKLRPDGRYSLTSFSGDVRISLPSGSAFELEASTFSGDIESDFEIRVSGRMSDKKIEGVVDRGGAILKLSTFSGDIVLKKE